MNQIPSALSVFRAASETVKAYQDFLKRNNVDPRSIKTKEDFGRLPILDKKTYIESYPLDELFAEGHLPPTLHASSGSSGKPTFWFRSDAQEEFGGSIHEMIFEKIFQLKKDEPTLVVVCFAMGVWIAGNYTLASCRKIPRRGWQLSTITPSVEKEDIMNTLRDLAPHFKNLILAGYPAFLMDVVHEARRRGIAFTGHTVKFLSAGDKFTEGWRDVILELVGSNDPYRSFVSIYGCADAGILGYETPLTIYLRRQAAKKKRLCRELFGDASILPALLQYDPQDVFFEEVGGELVFTTAAAMPLVRYNIHDTGRVIPYEDLRALAERHDVDLAELGEDADLWRLPFLVLKGRTDVAVTFYALNIYPEHIKAGLEDRRVAKFFSGNFLAYHKTLKRGKVQKLYLKLELKRTVKLTQNAVSLISRVVVEHLKKLNIEYRRLNSAIGAKAFPTILLVPSGDKNFFRKETKGMLQLAGKKPRVVL